MVNGSAPLSGTVLEAWMLPIGLWGDGNHLAFV
jgi:hypothetical protein